MPAKSTLNGTPPAAVSGDPSAGGQDPDLTAAGRQPAADPQASPPDGTSSAAERLTAERTERRRQRTAVREAPTPASEPGTARPRERRTEPTNTLTPSKRLTLRDSMSLTLIAVLAAGGVLGAILGAQSTSGWVIGVLAAGLTVVLSAVLRRYARST
jgi:hypothetical protein